MDIGLTSLDVVEMDRRRSSPGMLTPSPSYSGGSSDEAELDTEVDYDQAYRMLATTLGFENSRDASLLDVAAGNGPSNGNNGGGNGGNNNNALHGSGGPIVPQDQAPYQGPAQFPGVASMPGAHGFSNPLGTGSVTMPTPNVTNSQPQQQQQTVTSSPQTMTSPPPQEQMPQFMASVRNQGNVFPSPNAMMMQNLFGGNSGRESGSRGSNYNNPLVTFMRTLFQQQQQQQAQQQMQNSNNGNTMANIFNSIPEQILMENMFNFGQNNFNNQQQQQQQFSSRKSPSNGHQKSSRHRASSLSQRSAGGHYKPPVQRSPSAPWEFYVNRDGSDVIFPPFSPSPRLGCPGNG